MSPIDFPESNHRFGPPKGMDESQVKTIPAFVAEVQRGNLAGVQTVVVAWQPTPAEIEQIKNGAPIFLSMIGGLLPHFLSTSFKEATGL